MYRITKCDLCPANSPAYKSWLRNSPMLRPLDHMHILDVYFLLENYKHYTGKLALISSDKVEKDHAKEQLKKILWIFEQYGLSKDQLSDHLRYEHEIYIMRNARHAS